MAIRANNMGQRKTITWGDLGNRRTYVNKAFQVIQEEKKKKKDLNQLLKPWSSKEYQKNKENFWINMPEKPAVPPTTTTTTTTPVVLVEWQNATTQWQLEGDNWENVS